MLKLKMQVERDIPCDSKLKMQTEDANWRCKLSETETERETENESDSDTENESDSDTEREIQSMWES